MEEAITAGMEALPPDALFGLVTFDHRIGAWSLRNLADQKHASPLTHVHHIPVPKDSSCGFPMRRILPLERFVVPVG